MIRRVLLAIALLSVTAVHGTALEPVPAARGSLEPLFTPWDDIETAVVGVIDGARQQVLVQAYLLTSKKIATTLIAAHRRGVDVRVLVDAGQLDKVASSQAPALANAGIPVWLETKYQNAHNKVIVVDARTPAATVITGSFNFTWTAQHKNAENILIARDNPALATRYARNWERHREDATPYKK
ncbi:MAG TPA: phospholipase D family protein [Noviherbaspirillum sp.]|uniref:phospholipase D family nuclease n=1 Tax=Noviherbaspirillum sp. TaxID=1926288 RepID=UPI002D5807EC|nr:phospholipase D family protein [Noviherbaspirillum sp.]HYD94046.1 phospholipase D family protein [Noviherbaspirillum sp.]